MLQTLCDDSHWTKKSNHVHVAVAPSYGYYHHGRSILANLQTFAPDHHAKQQTRQVVPDGAVLGAQESPSAATAVELSVTKTKTKEPLHDEHRQHSGGHASSRSATQGF